MASHVIGMTSFVISILTIGFVQIATSEIAPPGSVVMRLANNAGKPVELFWINIFEADRPLVKQTAKPLRNGTDTSVNPILL
jgi:hypothetical protein